MLIHGFPELAYSWRKVILSLARADFTSSHRTFEVTDAAAVQM